MYYTTQTHKLVAKLKRFDASRSQFWEYPERCTNLNWLLVELNIVIIGSCSNNKVVILVIAFININIYIYKWIENESTHNGVSGFTWGYKIEDSKDWVSFDILLLNEYTLLWESLERFCKTNKQTGLFLKIPTRSLNDLIWFSKFIL